MIALGVGFAWLGSPPVGATAVPSAAGPAGGPAPRYLCGFNLDVDAFMGAGATASAIGWLGDHNSVVTCLGGTFLAQDGPAGNATNYGFGLYDGAPTTWTLSDGYLPAQITTFEHHGATVAITEFADRLVVGGHAYVAVYSRVRVSNPTDQAVVADPEASSGLVTLHAAPSSVPAHAVVDHDYVVALGPLRHRVTLAECARARRRWELRRALRAHAGLLGRAAGRHRAGPRPRPRARRRLQERLRLRPRSRGAATTLDTGVNGYESEFSHDVVGILTNLFTQGYFAGAHALLLEARERRRRARHSTSTVSGRTPCPGRYTW